MASLNLISRFSPPFSCACRTSVALLCAVLWFPLLCVVEARAQQPFATDDTDTTPRGRVHFEFSNTIDLLRDAALPAQRQNTASFELAYGVTDDLEISFEAPAITLFNDARLVDFEVTRGRVSGIGDANIAAKYNLRREREGSRVPAFAVGLNLQLPTGNVNRGIGSGATSFAITGLMQKSLTERTTLRGNLGVVLSGTAMTDGTNARGFVETGAASIVRRFGSRLYLGAEFALATSTNLDLGANQLQFQVGGNYFVRQNFSIDFGVATGVRSADPRAGFQLGFAYDF